MNKPNLPVNALGELDQRSRTIFRMIVESYLESGDPLGSRTLSRHQGVSVSPATIRNVMSDLEHLGLIFAPHISAGRLPTELGLRFFVDSFLEIGDLDINERNRIEQQVRAVSQSNTLDSVLAEASQILSGLTHSAGLVITDKHDVRLKHVEFIRLDAQRALVVIVGENDAVENRIIALPPGTAASALVEASNFINANIAGRTISEARAELSRLLDFARRELDTLASRLVEDGLATWSGASDDGLSQLIISGQANLLDDIKAGEDVERMRMLFDELESRRELLQLLDLAEQGDGVRIFIGSENKLFSLSGSSMIVAPYTDADQRVVGALGVIGPTRLNYARVVPMVDFTAQVISRLMRSGLNCK